MSSKNKKNTTGNNKQNAFNDEKKLFEKIRKGSMDARDSIINKYSGFIYGLARKYHYYFKNIETGELVAEGNRGLLEAIDRYDPSSAAKFSTYAWFWVVRNIQDYISSSITLIGMPSKVMNDLKKVVNSIEEEMKKGNSPSLEDIAKKVDIDLDKVKELLSDKKNIGKPLSLDRYISHDDEEGTLADLVRDKSLDSMQEIMDKEESKMNLNRLFEKLSPIEAEIIKWRYGFNDNKYHTLKEIGEKFSVSATKAKDIESIAIMKLKKFMAESDN
jgi:RNA polymerase sigma factor (sigma-70 family)